jgi:hypothetical protein
VVDVRIETGLLTDAIHVDQPLGLPFPMPGGISERPWSNIHNTFPISARKESVMRVSQLRGSGGISPLFPNIPLRDKGEG